MVLKFTEEEKNNILSIISDYEKVGKDMESLQKQSEEIQEKVDDCENKLKELKKLEEDLLKTLREKYGTFSLQDISDTLYGDK